MLQIENLQINPYLKMNCKFNSIHFKKKFSENCINYSIDNLLRKFGGHEELDVTPFLARVPPNECSPVLATRDKAQTEIGPLYTVHSIFMRFNLKHTLRPYRSTDFIYSHIVVCTSCSQEHSTTWECATDHLHTTGTCSLYELRWLGAVIEIQ